MKRCGSWIAYIGSENAIYKIDADGNLSGIPLTYAGSDELLAHCPGGMGNLGDILYVSSECSKEDIKYYRMNPDGSLTALGKLPVPFGYTSSNYKYIHGITTTRNN